MMYLSQSETTSYEDFRYDPNDPRSEEKLNLFVAGFGLLPVKVGDEGLAQLIENLVWRKTAAAIETDSLPALSVLLDLSEGNLVDFLTIRAGEVNVAAHIAKDTL